MLTRVANRPIWRGDHFALLGVKDTEMADLDAKTQKLATLRITPLYYPVTAPDHPALHELMDALECYDPAMVDEIAAIATPTRPPHPPLVPLLGFDAGFGVASTIVDSAREWNKLPQINPDQYVERTTEFRMLDDLASNVRVRIICLLGLGGTGKTTLLRRVFEDKSLAEARFPNGVLVYPIRDDAQADGIVDALCDRFPPSAPFDRDDRTGRLQHAGQVLRRKRMLLVLDGAELLQERPGQPEHGRFLSDDLRGLLLDLAREGQALVAITSRFTPIEFKTYLGASYRTIDLGGFTLSESTAFLSRAGVDGDEKTLTRVHESFEGHPLGLALFAGAITAAHMSALAGGNVPSALELLRSATSLDERLAALLDWYQRDLSAPQLAMLTLLAVYPTSVSQVELRALLRDGRVRAGDQVLAIGEGEEALASLQRLRLIQFDAEQRRYECHAIVRQGMRRRDPDAALAAITSLTGDAPISTPVTTVDELQRVVDAIEIAVESLGDFRQASRLITTRLSSGGQFFELGVPNIGVACFGRLISDDPWHTGGTRRQAAERAIGHESVGVYVVWMRDFHAYLGNLAEAERWRCVEGEYYIDWASKSIVAHYRYWLDGFSYLENSGAGKAAHKLRAKAWKNCGGAIIRAIDDPSLFADKNFADLALALCTSVDPRRNDPWSRLVPDLYHQSLRLPSTALASDALDQIARCINIFLPDRYMTPAGEHLVAHITTKPEEMRFRRDRLDLANYRICFVRVARGSVFPKILFDLARFANARYDAAEERVTLARAFLAVANTFDHHRAGPQAALAKSWAAEQLVYVGQAATALEWSNRALDVCREDNVERSRALYMRGKAHLALGRFAEAVADAEAATVLSRTIDKPFYIADDLELRWVAAKHADDVRSAAWEKAARTFRAKVYRQKDYDALPDFALLPGELGFHREYPHLELPDDLLAAVPPQLETLEAIANETFDDLLQRYRREVLKC